ncbi:DUF397 domain-containing protein [Streptomyces sp. NBC_01304]|uniref:DUF397 domain-containing protein n=1 Tax=Streptomyces sp. NBC_01304 TaxID=2903818 RepID=UPI002E0F0C46|nr:DUF397 domain-containing protein [Streptomyces sp. NBC_01304]
MSDTRLVWFKSSYSDDQGAECLEVALTPRTTHIRDSKLNPRSPSFEVPVDAWSAFVAYASTAPRTDV